MHAITLVNEAQAREVMVSAWAWVKSRVSAGKKVRLQLKEERRTLPQNDAIHPAVRRIAKASGRPADEGSLKVLRLLLLEAWRHETRRAPAYERSLDGMRIVCVDGGTSDLDKPDCSEFIDWLAAFEAEHVQ